MQPAPGLVVNNGGDKKCNSILVACHRLLPWPRNQSHVGHTPEHSEHFFVNLLGRTLRKECIDLENGVHGRAKIMGIRFLRFDETRDHFLKCRTQTMKLNT